MDHWSILPRSAHSLFIDLACSSLDRKPNRQYTRANHKDCVHLCKCLPVSHLCMVYQRENPGSFRYRISKRSCRPALDQDCFTSSISKWSSDLLEVVLASLSKRYSGVFCSLLTGEEWCSSIFDGCQRGSSRVGPDRLGALI